MVPKLSLYAVKAELQNKHLKRRWQSDAVDSSVHCLITLLYANDHLFPCKFIQSATANCLLKIFIFKKIPFFLLPGFVGSKATSLRNSSSYFTGLRI